MWVTKENWFYVYVVFRILPYRHAFSLICNAIKTFWGIYTWHNKKKNEDIIKKNERNEISSSIQSRKNRIL